MKEEKEVAIQITETTNDDGEKHANINFVRDNVSDIELLGALVYGLIMTIEGIKQNPTDEDN